MPDGSDSKVQRYVEGQIRSALKTQHGWVLSPQPLKLERGYRIDIDVVDASAKVAVEIVSRIGKRSASRDHKIVNDATNLMLAGRALGRGSRLFIVGCDEEFLGHYGRDGKKRAALALQELGVEALTVPLPTRVKKRIVGAQFRQGEINQRGTSA